MLCVCACVRTRYLERVYRHAGCEYTLGHGLWFIGETRFQCDHLERQQRVDQLFHVHRGTWKGGCATCQMQHATCHMQYATCNMSYATRQMQHSHMAGDTQRSTPPITTRIAYLPIWTRQNPTPVHRSPVHRVVHIATLRWQHVAIRLVSTGWGRMLRSMLSMLNVQV